MKLSNIKPKDAQWVIILYDHLRNNREMIMKLLEMARLQDCM